MCRKIFMLLILASNLMILLVACNGNGADNCANNIIGSWRTVYQDQVMTYTFDENNRVVFTNEKANSIDTGKYSFEGNTLCMTFYGSTEKAPIYISDDVIVCYGSKQVLERQHYTASDSDDNGVYGIWKSRLDGSIWFLDRDNTMTDLLQTYGFTQCGDIYVAHFLDDDFNTCPIAFTYDNDEITLYLGPVMRKIN